MSDDQEVMTSGEFLLAIIMNSGTNRTEKKELEIKIERMLKQPFEKSAIEAIVNRKIDDELYAVTLQKLEKYRNMLRRTMARFTAHKQDHGNVTKQEISKETNNKNYRFLNIDTNDILLTDVDSEEESYNNVKEYIEYITKTPIRKEKILKKNKTNKGANTAADKGKREKSTEMLTNRIGEGRKITVQETILGKTAKSRNFEKFLERQKARILNSIVNDYKQNATSEEQYYNDVIAWQMEDSKKKKIEEDRKLREKRLKEEMKLIAIKNREKQIQQIKLEESRKILEKEEKERERLQLINDKFEIVKGSILDKERKGKTTEDDMVKHVSKFINFEINEYTHNLEIKELEREIVASSHMDTRNKTNGIQELDTVTIPSNQIRAILGYKVNDPTIEYELIKYKSARNYALVNANKKKETIWLESNINTMIKESFSSYSCHNLLEYQAWQIMSQRLSKMTSTKKEGYHTSYNSGYISRIGAKNKEELVQLISKWFSDSRYVMTYKDVENWSDYMWEKAKDGKAGIKISDEALEIKHVLNEIRINTGQEEIVGKMFRLYLLHRFYHNESKGNSNFENLLDRIRKGGRLGMFNQEFKNRKGDIQLMTPANPYCSQVNNMNGNIFTQLIQTSTLCKEERGIKKEKKAKYRYGRAVNDYEDYQAYDLGNYEGYTGQYEEYDQSYFN